MGDDDDDDDDEDDDDDDDVHDYKRDLVMIVVFVDILRFCGSCAHGFHQFWVPKLLQETPLPVVLQRLRSCQNHAPTVAEA